jgi:hypothetical protein
MLAPYSKRMKKLLEDDEGFYRLRLRTSGHDISRGFASDKKCSSTGNSHVWSACLSGPSPSCMAGWFSCKRRRSSRQPLPSLQ